ncbi:putative HxlR family transcriptional regulator [Gordonia effusa NBRC 100432]|uniref:Putative HxlR family transcriptional regulator n=1 Tax=Gordonia effusa NBRC 100432 TaxID=1077974 RepID=H0QWX7_9ACTN|nr:helix-turn-helix domain-containing protein [Gordonia effusa]GAB17328.1 putative HxlR family transcriptional regulator [Gordonia effusa NBRC 100432]
MRHDDLADKNCAVARTWAIIGERWTMMILREFFRGEHRFDPIARKLGLGRSVLTDRLRMLVDEGILERRQYDSAPDRLGYHLTTKGEELYPLFVAVIDWGDKWAVDNPPVTLTHAACGHQPHVSLRCENCDTDLTRRDIHAEFAPDAW